MYKKISLPALFTFFISLHAMDSDFFGMCAVALSGELTIQEKEEKETKKHMQKNQKVGNQKYESGYNSTEIKIMGIGLVASVAFIAFDYMRR
jgi:tetrahydromethanopterin S-methyltransferase subunit A